VVESAGSVVVVMPRETRLLGPPEGDPDGPDGPDGAREGKPESPPEGEPDGPPDGAPEGARDGLSVPARPKMRRAPGAR
jgi:hypothetical protein